MCLLSCSVLFQLFVTPWTVARQSPLSVEFSRQGYWNELSFPPPGDLPDPGTKSMSLKMGIHYFIALCSVVFFFSFFLKNKLEVCGNSMLNKSIKANFFQQHLLTSFLGLILVILTIFQAFSSLLYFLWWSVIKDLCCCYCCNILGHHKPGLYGMANLTDTIVCVLMLCVFRLSHQLAVLLSPSISLGLLVPQNYWN